MTKLRFTLAALVFVVAACGTSAETERKLADLEQVNAQNDTLIAKLRYVVARVQETENALNQSRERVKGLTQLSDSLRAAYDSTVGNLQSVIASQKTTIDLLTDQVSTLSAENVALRDSLSTGYYIVGTRDELKKKGILTEQGGGRVLFVLWRTGKTLQPARNLDPSLFTPIDTRQVTQIPLPVASAQYRVASLQDLSYVAEERSNNRYSGVPSLTITSPVDFWRTSKFLIIIREGRGDQVASGASQTPESQAISR